MARPPAKSANLTVDHLEEHLLGNNPFSNNRVTTVSTASHDIHEIHAKAFERLTGFIKQCPRQEVASGVLLWGEAGIGKSHMIARTAHWASKQENAVLVLLHNIHASADRLPGYLVKCILNRLLGGRVESFYETQLFRIVNRTLSHALEMQGHGKETTEAVLRDCFEKLVEEILGDAGEKTHPVDREIFWVFYRFFISTFRKHYHRQPDTVAQLAVRWLSGDFLEPAEREQLSLRHTPEVGAGEGLDSQLSERVLFVITELARFRDQPVVICLDQVENLEDDQFASLCQFLHGLLDACRNLLVVVSGVKSKLIAWYDSRLITQAAWDRLHDHRELELHRVSEADGRRIVTQRLQDYFHPFQRVLQGVDPRPWVNDPLFPLGQRWWADRTAGLSEMRPRDVVNWSRDQWIHQQELLQELKLNQWLKQWPDAGVVPPTPTSSVDELIDGKIDGKITECINQRKLHQEGFPPDADNLCGLAASALEHCKGEVHGYSLISFARCQSKPKSPKPTFDIIATERCPEHGKTRTTGLKMLVTENKTQAYWALKRIADDRNPPDHLLVIIDSRRPLAVGPAGEEILQKLITLGESRFRVIELKIDELAHLDALISVIGDARSSDLEVQYPPQHTYTVSEAEVIASHHRMGRFREDPLIKELVTEAPLESPSSPQRGRIDQQKLTEFVYGQISLTMGATTVSLARSFLKGPGKHLGIEEFTARKSIEEVVERLYKEGLINITPQDDYYYCLYLPGNKDP
jgi:hypothetical protein